MFTDIEDSSKMTNDLGCVYLDELLPEHNERMRAVVTAHDGYVVKSIGDSFMLAFQKAEDAVACAVAIQEAVSKPPILATDEAGKTRAIKVRIGVHQAVERLEPRSSPECPADYIGSDANFAARVESLGAGGQIVISDPTYHAAKLGGPERWKQWPNRRIKSFDLPETVWEFLWDGQSRGEPGSRFLPDWFKGEQNRYIPRPELESSVLGHFGKLRPDGSVPRLVTLHAYGGMGKTRLAIACAIQAVGVFKDGVLFARLDNKSPTAPAVAETIGAALGLAGEAAPPHKVIAALSDKDLLLLLDNYESVDSEEVQGFLIELLKSTTAVRLLVTGREAVKLSDVEQEVSLDEGMMEAEAGDLFLARARLKHQLGQQWQPDEEQQEGIRRIVRLSERIPLAIELAAAWVNHSTVKEIADGIEATPLGSESKEPPRSGRIDQAPRHRSLTRSLNYSYERLEPVARVGFARLGLFAGSFVSDSVQPLCEVPHIKGYWSRLRDVLARLRLSSDESGKVYAEDLLLRLQDASLIYRIEADGRSRYTMLRPTRAYSAEKLAELPEAPSLRQQFIRYFWVTAWQIPRRKGIRTDTKVTISALDWFEDEWPNLLAAAKSASEMQARRAILDISDVASGFLQVRGRWAEAEELYSLALVASRDSKDRRREGQNLNNLGLVYETQGRWGEAEKAFHQCLTICRECKDRHFEGIILSNLGNVYRDQGRWAEAEQACQQGLTICREFKNRHSEGTILNNLGNVHQVQGQWSEAEKAYQESLAIMREFKDRHGEGRTISNLGAVYHAQGRWAEAEQAYHQSLAIYQEFKDRHGEGNVLNNLGNVYQVQTRWAEAEQAFQHSLEISREFKDRLSEGRTLINMGAVYNAQSRWAEAEQAFQQSLTIFREFKDRYGEALTLNNLGLAYGAQSRFGEAEQGQKQSLAIYRELNHRPGEAQTLNNLGNVYQAQGRWAEAEQAYQQSLAVYRELKDRNVEAITLCRDVARMSLMVEKYDDSISASTLAIEMAPHDPSGYELRAAACWYSGRYDQALRDYSMVLDLNPESPSAYHGRGSVLAEMGKYLDATKDLEKAISLTAKGSALEAHPRNALALAFAGLQDYDRALKEFDLSIKLRPNNAWVYYNRALAYELMGKPDEALGEFAMALEKKDPPLNALKRERARARLSKGI